MSDLRKSLVTQARRIVVKIGSRTVAADSKVHSRIAAAFCKVTHLPPGNQGQAETVAADSGTPEKATAKSFVLVSSGAIALGLAPLGLKTRPREMAKLQAAAAAGQSTLMRRYEESFEEHGVRVAQVLLTHADLADRTRANNARGALEALLDASVVPIINENDTVSVEEIKFGDNDQLAAMVASLVSADLLILLSDVEGLLDQEGKRVSVVRDVASEAMPLVGMAPLDTMRVAVGVGGMGSKLEAARRASLAGATVIIADARSETALEDALAGKDVGTLVLPAAEPLGARKHWIAFTLRPKGALLLDSGAHAALRDRGGSLLAVGVLGVRGAFAAGESVSLVDPAGREVGRGLAALSALDVARLAGKKGPEVEAILGRPLEALVHRDDLVLL